MDSYTPIPVYGAPEPSSSPPDQEFFDRSRSRKIFSRAGFAFTAALLLYSMAQLALIYAIGLYIDRLGYMPQWLSAMYSFILLLPFYLVGVPFCALVLGGLPTDRRLRERKLPGRMFPAAIAMSITGMLMGNLVGTLLMTLINLLLPSPSINSVADMVSGSNVWMNLLFFCILTPIMEELAFRKLLLDRISIFGDRTAMLVSGLMFGLFHGNLYQFFYAFILGMIFSWVYLRSGKIYLTVIMHAIINFVGGVAGPFVLNQADIEAMTAAGADIFSRDMLPGLAVLGSYVIVIYGTGILGFALFFALRRRLVTEPGLIQIPKGKGVSTVICNPGMLVFCILCLIIFLISLVS